MRTYVFPWLPGGLTRIISSWFFTWKLAANPSRASRSRGSRLSSYNRNIKFTCSFVTSPMLPPLAWIIDCIFKGLDKWIFVRAGPVNRRHWNIQHSQIDRELPAMVIVMIHKDGSDECDPWDGHQDLSFFRQAPRGGKPGVVHILQGVLGTPQALGESVQDFLATLGLRLREVRDFHTVRHSCCSNTARHGGDMQGQLAQGKSFRVGFPGEFVLWNSIQHSFGRLCFLVNLHQDGICKSHNSSFRLSLQTKLVRHERGQSARGHQTSGHHHYAADTKWAHRFLHLPDHHSPRTRRFRPLFRTRVHIPPPRRNSLTVVLLNQSQRRVSKLNQRPAIHLAEAVLHIRNDRIRHKQWARDFQKRRPFDSLHHSPEVAVPVPQIAVPPAPRPRLDLHGHRFVVRHCVEGSELLQQRGKRRLQRRAYVDLFYNIQRHVLNSYSRRNHLSSL